MKTIGIYGDRVNCYGAKGKERFVIVQLGIKERLVKRKTPEITLAFFIDVYFLFSY